MSSDLSQKVLLAPLKFGDPPIFVNAMQHARILIRRAARQKLLKQLERPPKVQSRVELAIRRKRTRNGKFMKREQGEEPRNAEETTEMH